MEVEPCAGRIVARRYRVVDGMRVPECPKCINNEGNLFCSDYKPMGEMVKPEDPGFRPMALSVFFVAPRSIARKRELEYASD